MSLCDKSFGLLETHVDWEDVEDALTSAFGVFCKMGPNKKLFQIGEGKGFISRIALIDPDWVEPSSCLPQRFCVKICSQLPQVEYDEEYARTEKMENLFKLMHNSEVDTYEIFEKYRTPQLKAAKLYAAHRFSSDNPLKGFLILPFYENLAEVNVTDNLGIDEVEQVLEAIVEMAAVTLKLPSEQLDRFTKNMFSTVCGTYHTPRHIDSNMKKIRQYLGSRLPELCDRLDEIKYDIGSMESFREMDDLCQKLVITHGDLWSTNLLWSKNGEGAHQLEAIVDYQSPALSTPAVDIVSFICSSLSGADRLQYTDYILEKYYNIWTTKVPSGNLPFTREQLKTSFIHVFSFHGFEILGTLMEIYDLEDAEIKNDHQLEEKVLEKAAGLLKSILEYYELSKNMKNTQK